MVYSNVIRELIGSAATIVFMISAMPLAWEALKSGKSDAPWSAIILVMLGSVLMAVYGCLLYAWPLVIDMVVTFLCWAIVGGVKYRASLANFQVSLNND